MRTNSSQYLSEPAIIYSGDKSYYTKVKDVVSLPNRSNFNSSEEYYNTLFHELSHSTGHSSRFNQKSVAETTSFGSDFYSFEDLIAEISAFFLCNEAGIDDKILNNSAYNINSWISILKEKFQEDATCFVKASSKALAVADFILNRTNSSDINNIHNIVLNPIE